MRAEEKRLLVVAPTGRDAVLVCDILRRHGMSCEPCRDICDACRTAENGVGVLVIAEEALVRGALEELSRLFDTQPKWSNIPVILLTSNGDRIHAAGQALLAQKGMRGNLMIVERPVRRATLLAAVETAVQVRLRQYELRDHLQELARQEERLRQSQKIESVGILAGGIAHDFNNLLTGVLGNASLALETLPPHAPARGMIEGVVAASERAAHLTRQLLAYAGKGRFVVESLDLSRQVREIAALIQTSIPKNVQLRLDLADNQPMLQADGSQIQQVVMNLVINGAEAIPEGENGMVLVATGVQDVDQEYLGTVLPGSPVQPGRYITLEVHDTGTGMDEATQARIFDPFFTTKFTGRGLGLAAVLGIVQGHKGALKIYSAPGRGTTFKVLFPAGGEAPVAAPAPPETVHAAAKGHVLVIDDEQVVRQVAKRTLENFGYTVTACEDGPKGIEAFRKLADKVEAVLLDMSMPVMSGEETFRRLRSIRPEIKVILSSGYNEVEAISRFTGKGLAGFIQKPYTAARLSEIIRSVLEK
jgi:signal transduction histidine kinase/ActR/RegA family two-component response regulator